MTLSFEDMWIKAAVEHRILNITYVNKETRLVYTKRDICPDFLQMSDQGASAVWALIGHAPQLGIKAFNPANFEMVRVTDTKFQPPPGARWNELVALYKERGLDQKPF